MTQFPHTTSTSGASRAIIVNNNNTTITEEGQHNSSSGSSRGWGVDDRVLANAAHRGAVNPVDKRETGRREDGAP